MLSKDLEQTLNDAFRSARAKRHEFMTVEHLLLALLDNNDAIRVLKACGADMGSLRGDLVEFVDATTPLIPEDEEQRDTQPTLGFQRVLQRAVFHINLLEAPAQGLVLIENTTVFLERGGPNTSKLSRAEQRLQQIASVHHPA